MKKSIPLAAITLCFTLGLIVSCTKVEDGDPTGNYLCQCTVTTASGPQTVDVPLNNLTLSEATSTCETTENNYNSTNPPSSCNLQ